MTMIRIDKDKAIELLEAAVAERGAGYIYQEESLATGGVGCLYTKDGAPSCGVGLALFKAGVPLSTLKIFDNPELLNYRSDVEEPEGMQFIGGAIDEITESGLSDALGVEITPEASIIFGEFQWKQDRKESWGEAINAAKQKDA